jgi:transposase
VLSTARGYASLELALSGDHPYDPELVRAVRLIEEAGELFLDITAWVAVAKAGAVPEKVAGVDPGIVHPLAIAAGAARLATGFMVANHVTLAVIGNPTGIEKKASGRQQNRRTARWARTHQRDALCYRLAEVGISAVLTEERGTSSVCPTCGAKAAKKGRRLVCSILACNKAHHRDVAGAQNMVTKLGHAPSDIARTEHRRVGSPARRDRRRHLFDADRGLARTRAAAPSVLGAESLAAPKAA